RSRAAGGRERLGRDRPRRGSGVSRGPRHRAGEGDHGAPDNAAPEEPGGRVMFRVGDEVALDFVLDGTPTAEVERPDGTTSPLTPVPVGDGVRVSFTADQAGRHVVVCATATKTQVEVVNVHSARPRAIASLAELKEHMNMTDTQHDDELREHLEAATLVVEQHTGQVIARRTVSGERHRVGRRRPLVLKQVPVVSVESVTARSGSTPPLDEIEVIAETG